MKTVFGWVADWNEYRTDEFAKTPDVTIDYYFSSREAFEKVVGKSVADSQTLVPIKVSDEFDDMDYCSDNY